MRNLFIIAVLMMSFVMPLSSHALQVHSADILVADGSSGQNTSTGNGVKTNHIQDGAVTDAKIGGPVSPTKIDKLTNVLTVAKGMQGFGTYSTISGALGSLSSPNTTPTVIKVMPGTYQEQGGLTMKSNVHLNGAGRDITVINGPIIISSVDNVTISDFTVRYPSYIGGIYGTIHIYSSSPVIKGNYFDDGSAPGIGSEIWCNQASPTIEDNLFKDIWGHAISTTNNSSALIKNNRLINSGNDPVNEINSSSTIVGNVFEGAQDHSYIGNSNTIIMNNIIKNSYAGFYIASGGSPIIKNNIITGSTSNYDIYVAPGAWNITSNTYEKIQGSGTVGAYNTKPDGSGW